MQTKLRRKLSLLFVAFAALLAIPAIALADDIANSLDPSVDTVAEVMPLTANGTNGTTTLCIVERNGDGKNGCNLTGSTTASFSIASNNNSVATVSPSSVTFGSCGDVKTLTVTPHNQGTATISLAQTSNTTAGAFNVEPATFTVNVAPPPNTPPTVTVTGVTGGASYAKGSVPAATCQVTDAEDGNSSFPATLSAISGPYAIDGIGLQTASCSYTDAGGLTVEASESYGIIDPTPPAISKVVTGTLGSNDWYTSNVKLDWTVSEPQSPNSLQKSGCVDQIISSDQHATIYSCSATSAGGSSGPVEVAIKRDATAPTNIAFVGGGLADGASYDFGSVPAGPTGCTANGAISGLASCDVGGYSPAVGPHTVTATATDNAGNTATKTLNYGVAAWSLSGFYQPVDMNDTVNTVKGGSTVPVKFELFQSISGTELKSTSNVSSISARQVSCSALTGDPTDAIEYLAPTSEPTGLRFDTTGDQFIYNWKTPKSPNTCYSLTMNAVGGSSPLVAYFKLT